MESQQLNDKNLQGNEEDILMSLECAENIKHHLNRQINKESNLKYINNREALDFMIESFEHSLLKSRRLNLVFFAFI